MPATPFVPSYFSLIFVWYKTYVRGRWLGQELNRGDSTTLINHKHPHVILSFPFPLFFGINVLDILQIKSVLFSCLDKNKFYHTHNCLVCPLAKQTRLSFSLSQISSQTPFENYMLIFGVVTTLHLFLGFDISSP